MVRNAQNNAHILDDGTGCIDNGTIFESLEFEEDAKHKKAAFYHIILLNRTFRVVMITAVVAICLPMVFYLVFYSREWGSGFHEKEYGTCGYYDVYHLPCGIEDMDKSACQLRGCCFNDNHGCYHSLPSRTRFRTQGNEWNEEELLEPLYPITPLEQDSLKGLKLHINEVSTHVVELTLYDPQEHSFTQGQTIDDTEYMVKVFAPTFYVEVYRKEEDNQTLLSSARGPLIVSDKYFEWSIFLNADFLIGLGEQFLHEGQSYLLFNNEANSTVPFVMAYNSKSRSYHAIWFTASAPIEIRILDTKLIMVRGFRHDMFQIMLFTGSTPADIYQQVRQFGSKLDSSFTNVNYWHLGVHVCNENTNNITNAVDEIQILLQAENINKFPFDSHCIMDKLIWFTDDKLPTELEPVILKLKESKKFVASIVTLLELGESTAYQLAKENNILMKSFVFQDVYEGFAYGRNVSYVDFVQSKESTQTWLQQVWEPKLAEIQADGYFYLGSWLPDERNDIVKIPEAGHVPYVPENMETAMKNLPPWTISSPNDYNLTLMYQNTLTEETIKMLKTFHQNEWMISSSPTSAQQIPSYKYVSEATWVEFRKTIDRHATFALAGIKNYGSAVCGSYNYKPKQEELCIRWYQFASLTSLFKVNTARFIDKFSLYAQRTMTETIRRRYSLLEYMRSVIIQDEPLIRPLYYDFPEIMPYVENVTHHFMIGPSLMAVPVSLPLVMHLSIHFPVDFYEIWGGMLLKRTSFRREPISFPVVMSDLPLFLQSGHIVALHKAENSVSAEQSRLESFYLKIGLKCISEDTDLPHCEANGKLWFNERLHFTLQSTEKHLTLTITSNVPDEDRKYFCDENPTISNHIDYVEIYGDPANPKNEILQHKINLDICTVNWNEPNSIEYLI